MNVLVVLAHPEARSFNGALRDAALEALAGAGHPVRQSDLYAMRFEAVCGPRDFREVPAGPAFNVQAAQRAAVAEGTQAPDIAAEQEKLRWADIVIIIFPLWWFGMPAILKGWIDRVFALDEAYGGGRWFDRGVYRGKRALVCLTTGGRPDRFRPDGLFGSLDVILHPLRVGVLNFCGFDTLEPFVAWAAAGVDEQVRAGYLAAWRARLAGIDREAPQPFRHLADFPDPAMRDHRGAEQ